MKWQKETEVNQLETSINGTFFLKHCLPCYWIIIILIPTSSRVSVKKQINKIGQKQNNETKKQDRTKIKITQN